MVLHNSLVFRYKIGEDTVLFSIPFTKNCLRNFRPFEQMCVNPLTFLIKEMNTFLGLKYQMPALTNTEEDKVICERTCNKIKR